MIENFVDSVLIIDDKEDEISELRDLLEGKGIWVRHLTASMLATHEGFLKNRRLIFLDLSLDDSISPKENIARIRKHFVKKIGVNFGVYGIVLWTKHPEEVKEFKMKIQLDVNLYSHPLFIIDLDKNNYLRDGYKDIYNHINDKLSNDFTACFLMQWDMLVNAGKNNTIINIFSLENNYEYRNDNLKYILSHLAQNYSGINIDKIRENDLYRDAFKSFSDMLQYAVSSQEIKDDTLFGNLDNIKYNCLIGRDKHCAKTFKGDNYINGEKCPTDISSHDQLLIGRLNSKINDVFSDINTKILIDEKPIMENIVMPGNVYEVIDITRYNEFYKDWPGISKSILIEISPPCDFSQQNSILSRCILGGITEYSGKKRDIIKKKDYFYKELFPIRLKYQKTNNIIFFDLRAIISMNFDELRNSGKYNLIFRVKDKLFADILQKFSSHAARLGLSIIHN